jgi:hypothetical protein
MMDADNASNAKLSEKAIMSIMGSWNEFIIGE